jgi:hypothetical protein
MEAVIENPYRLLQTGEITPFSGMIFVRNHATNFSLSRIAIAFECR